MILFASVSQAFAQEVYSSSGKPGYYKKTHKKKGYDPGKLVVGGSLNAGFSNGGTSAGINPIVGYKFTDHFLAGVGLGYQYYRYISYTDYYNNNYFSTDNIIYPSIWARYFVYRNFFVDATFEYDFISQRDPIDANPASPNYGDLVNTTTNINVPCMLVGIGYKWMITGRVSFFAEVMYDVLQEDNSPYYGQLVPRAGICAGL